MAECGALHDIALAFNSAARRSLKSSNSSVMANGMMKQQSNQEWGKSEVDIMILCFDLLKYIADLEQLELGIASTVVRLIDLASAQLINSDAKEREQQQQQYNQVGSGDADHQVQVCEKQDLAELIGLAFSWLQTLSRYPQGRHSI